MSVMSGSGVNKRNTRSEHMFSGLPPTSDIPPRSWHVVVVPATDICAAARRDHSITSSARLKMRKTRIEHSVVRFSPDSRHKRGAPARPTRADTVVKVQNCPVIIFPP
jgi:hypothetical protein